MVQSKMAKILDFMLLLLLLLGMVKRKKKKGPPALNLQMEKHKPRSDNVEEEPEQPPVPQTSGSSGPIKSAPDQGLPW